MARARAKSVSKPHSSLPGWSVRIERLRKTLGLSRTQFSQQLQYSPMAISRWERGIQEPPAECYIKLGKMAAGQDRWFFWERAGLRKEDLQNKGQRPKQVSADFDRVVAGSGGKKHLARRQKLVALPLLKVRAGSHGEEGDVVSDLNQSPPEQVIAAPAEWCPHPNTTSCLRVKGRSMIPLIYDGDILAVDSSQTKFVDLNDKLILASHKKRGLCVSRFRHIDGIDLLESDNRDYRPIEISHDRNWQIVGKVLWLIRQAP